MQRTQAAWVNYSDEQLLDMRFCDFDLKITDLLQQRIDRLYEELQRRDLSFRPHTWLSIEWFSPDGVPGIAIPFYLAHPRLTRLERNQMMEVEGGSDDWCMRILRHEAGHAYDTAYRLHLRRKWREVFGKHTEPYPESYHVQPSSKNYVLHLNSWYAQSHPSEDFAETFAVWLGARKNWRRKYAGWHALTKLEYVDDLMNEIADTRPAIQSRKKVDSISANAQTLRDHYEIRREHYGIGQTLFYDQRLREMFSSRSEYGHCATAASYLRQHRSELRRQTAYWTHENEYALVHGLDELI
ncbi:MAG: putative zinc-binding metallopeptidase, partial [bacterium]|nr:putative zinc-binding metallopeptidase [bacterium]